MLVKINLLVSTTQIDQVLEELASYSVDTDLCAHGVLIVTVKRTEARQMLTRCAALPGVLSATLGASVSAG